MRFLVVALVVIGIFAGSSVARADKRVAFVVGNGAYRNVPTLPNPPMDAAAMAAMLRKVGFDVVEGVNLARDEMTRKLLDFGQRAQGAEIAVFYYAGHGIAISGVNYLLPVDADIKSEIDVKLGAAINVDVTLDQTSQGEAGVPRCLPRQPVCGQDQAGGRADQAERGPATGPRRDEIGRGHPDLVCHRPGTDCA
jgi:hypothetical protein